jgi:hypothetical protein
MELFLRVNRDVGRRPASRGLDLVFGVSLLDQLASGRSVVVE